jgi:hypothetical protein
MRRRSSISWYMAGIRQLVCCVSSDKDLDYTFVSSRKERLQVSCKFKFLKQAELHSWGLAAPAARLDASKAMIHSLSIYTVPQIAQALT